jgi:transcriptional regulator with XRE-family HTH domain
MLLAAPPAPQDLALVLREGRASLGGGDAKRFPQPRMAELLGVSLRQYQRWERGVSQPRPRDLERIVATLAGGGTPAAPPEPGRLLEELASLRRQVNALRGELDTLRASLAALAL